MTGMTQPAACPAEEVLKAYVDGELSPEEQSKVRTHLHGCSTCAGEVEVMKIIGSELRGLEGSVEPPAGLRGRILNRIDFTPERRRRSGLGFLRWASLAVAAVVVLFVAFALTPPAKESARTTSTNSALKQLASGSPAASSAPVLPDNQGGFAPQRSFQSNGTTTGDDRPFASASTLHIPDGSAKGSAGEQPFAFGGKRTGSPGGGMPGRDSHGDAGRRNGDPYSPLSRSNPFRETPDLKDVETSLPTSAGVPARARIGIVSDVDRFARGKLDGPVSRKVFQSADLSVRIDRKLESVQDEVAGHLKKLGGYVEESSLSSPEGTQERVSDMVLRAPVDQFETTLSWLSGLGDVTAKNLSGKDVTGRWIDERATLREMRKEENRLSKELDQAKKPAVIQSIRWQLLRLRPRIAAAEDQFAATSKLAALATIRLKLLERPEARVRGNLIDDMGRTTHTAWAAFLVALRVPAPILIWLAVFSPLWLPCLLVYRWATKKLDEERRRARTEVYGADPVV